MTISRAAEMGNWAHVETMLDGPRPRHNLAGLWTIYWGSFVPHHPGRARPPATEAFVKKMVNASDDPDALVNGRFESRVRQSLNFSHVDTYDNALSLVLRCYDITTQLFGTTFDPIEVLLGVGAKTDRELIYGYHAYEFAIYAGVDDAVQKLMDCDVPIREKDVEASEVQIMLHAGDDARRRTMRERCERLKKKYREQRLAKAAIVAAKINRVFKRDDVASPGTYVYEALREKLSKEP